VSKNKKHEKEDIIRLWDFSMDFVPDKEEAEDKT
jgi:hypothetical protein